MPDHRFCSPWPAMGRPGEILAIQSVVNLILQVYNRSFEPEMSTILSFIMQFGK